MYLLASRVVRGGGESLRKYAIALATIVAVLMLAPAVSAGPEIGWGKGFLSETTMFYVGDSEVASGYMYWCHYDDSFVYDFHGYYLEAGTVYYLIAYDGEPQDEPDDYLLLGSGATCEYLGVHIKGNVDWPGIDEATVCLVPGTYDGFDGTDGWMYDTYEVAYHVDLS